jgi:hypothetical protein
MPILRVGDGRAGRQRGPDLSVDDGHDRIAAADREAAGRIGEVVLDVDDDEGRGGVVALHVDTLAQVARRSPLRPGWVRPATSLHPSGIPSAQPGPRRDAVPCGTMYFDEFKQQLPDIDEAETQEWL